MNHLTNIVGITTMSLFTGYYAYNYNMSNHTKNELSRFLSIFMCIVVVFQYISYELIDLNYLVADKNIIQSIQWGITTPLILTNTIILNPNYKAQDTIILIFLNELMIGGGITLYYITKYETYIIVYSILMFLNIIISKYLYMIYIKTDIPIKKCNILFTVLLYFSYSILVLLNKLNIIGNDPFFFLCMIFNNMIKGFGQLLIIGHYDIIEKHNTIASRISSGDSVIEEVIIDDPIDLNTNMPKRRSNIFDQGDLHL